MTHAITFPEELPISASVRDIAQAIHDRQVVIVAGETGSGKTTQLPKICLAMGRGLEAHIGVTQPRRIAATSVAARVAEELGVELGREVGYQIRFAKRAGPGTYVKFMTDGVLLAEIGHDPLLRAYDTIIVDEAHERSLNIDFLLGWLRRTLPKRPDLRVVVSSATLEIERFSRFFGDAPVVRVSGRTYPVETIYRPQADDEDDLAETIANVVEELTTLDPREDVLVFLPGEREIREAMSALEAHALPRTEILPLYGRLTQEEQARVFRPSSQRRVVLSTNVAETSLTIPGIAYVIDTGTARVNRYVARTGVTQLLVEPISKASADQRRGRAGRVKSGVCYRLYEEADFALRSEHTDPEVLRVGLAGAILQMKALGLGDIAHFPFLDPPPKRAVDEGHRVLVEIGALGDDGELTSIGKKLARLPVDPRIGRMILGGEAEGALAEVLVVAAALGIQDPRERPHALQKRADEQHRRFARESDFATLLAIFHAYRDEGKKRTRRQLEKWCKDAFLSPQRMREWVSVHAQLESLAQEMGAVPSSRPASLDALHKALLPGLLSRLGMWRAEDRSYLGARQTRFVLHPSSALAKKPPAWVVVAELVETSQLFGRIAAKIDPEWLEVAAGAQVRRSHGDPHWSERSAEAMVREHASLFGLPVVRDRSVRLGPIDPVGARRLFIVHALVRGEWSPRPPPRFVEHNRRLFEEVRALRARARRSDMLADDDAVAAFFERVVPEGVFSLATFETFRKAAEARDPKVLHLALSDVLVGDDADLTPARFPDVLRVSGVELALAYVFEPSSDTDGVTAEVPIAVLSQLDPEVLEWTVPGYVNELVRLLLYGLPARHRKAIGDVDGAAAAVASALAPFSGPMRAEVAKAIGDLTGASIRPDDLAVRDLPLHLRLRFVVTEAGKVLGEGRDLAELRARFGAVAKQAFRALPRDELEREGMTTFPAAGLATEVTLEARGTKTTGYPALVDAGASVSLRVMETRAEADRATRSGIRKLALLAMGTSIERVEKMLPGRLASVKLADPPGPVGPRRQVAMRALDEAFELVPPGVLPRSRADFDARVATGQRRVDAALAEWGKLAELVAVLVDEARTRTKAMRGQPGAPKASLDDMTSQLDALAPHDLFLEVPRERLLHYPRYLRAVSVRLDRLPNGPQKDLSKMAEVAPLWSELLSRREALAKRGVPSSEIDACRWLVEELRVSVFAPELRAAVSVSPARVAEVLRDLARRA